MYILEDTSFFNRLFLGGIRPWEMVGSPWLSMATVACENLLSARLIWQNVSSGGAAGGPQIAKFVRPCRFGAGPAKCCCYQEVEVQDPASGQSAGTVVEQCWYCVPMFDIKRPDGTVEYRLSMPTCMGGVCVDICAEGTPFKPSLHLDFVALLCSVMIVTIIQAQEQRKPSTIADNVWMLGQGFATAGSRSTCSHRQGARQRKRRSGP